MAKLVALLKQGLSYPGKMIKGRKTLQESTLDTIAPDSGDVVLVDGEKVAAYKDSEGQVTKFSPVCSHLKCIVDWNDSDKTWDCPCHNSRFEKTGEVKQGPAKKPLSKLE